MFFIFIFTCLQTNFHYICTNLIQRIAKVQTRNLAIVCLVCLRLIENAA